MLLWLSKAQCFAENGKESMNEEGPIAFQLVGETPAAYGTQFGQTNPAINMNGMDSTNGMNNNQMGTMNQLLILRQFEQMVRQIFDDCLNENRLKLGSNNNNNRGQQKNGRRNTSLRF